MKKIILYCLISYAVILTACAQNNNKKINQAGVNTSSVGRVEKSEEEWKKLLTPEQFYVLRQKGTERAFTGSYYKSKEKGVYACAGCGLELFKSDHKFDSGTGWPSYWQPIQKNAVKVEIDKSHGMVREEVLCARCDGHLGHVFDDGPQPTGLRYCINSVSLTFKKIEKDKNK